MRRRASGNGGCLVAVVIALIIAVIGIADFAIQRGTQRTVTATVTDKERVCSRGVTDCKYLIFTDHGTFKDTDSLAYLKFNSSDVYGAIQRGKTYTFTVSGWRFGLTSSYPNIVKVDNAG